jgi:hypothetical protein
MNKPAKESDKQFTQTSEEKYGTSFNKNETHLHWPAENYAI